MKVQTLLLPAIIFLSCNNNQAKNDNTITQIKVDTITSSIKSKLPDTLKNVAVITDSAKRFEVDDFPVTNEMLTCNDNSSTCEVKYKELVSFDKIWFTNDTLKQTLVFEMYTDKFRVAAFLFDNKNITADLIKTIEFNTADGDVAPDKLKSAYFKNFIPLARKINSAYFKSNKGFKLGDPKEKFIRVYGKPDNIETVQGIEEYYWEFIGELLYDGKKDLKNKPLAKDNFGHQVTMFFKNNKLIAFILHNDIP